MSRSTERCGSRDCKRSAEPAGGGATGECVEGKDGRSVELLQGQREGTDAVRWLTLLPAVMSCQVKG